MLVFNDIIFCRLAETAVSGSPSVTWLFSEVTSVWGVSAVAILDCSSNVYECGRQKALPCRPTVLQQTVTTHKQPKA